MSTLKDPSEAPGSDSFENSFSVGESSFRNHKLFKIHKMENTDLVSKKNVLFLFVFFIKYLITIHIFIHMLSIEAIVSF
jgi:hypothetical protein